MVSEALPTFCTITMAFCYVIIKPLKCSFFRGIQARLDQVSSFGGESTASTHTLCSSDSIIRSTWRYMMARLLMARWIHS
jgi:hypothetical protein